jgi:N-acyl-D-aspartate/D-glutamate deacylase
MDPESGLDAIRSVGITGRKITAISSRALKGKITVNAEGLVVAPGFIDLHQHSHRAQDYELKAMDGVTTALDLEAGGSGIPERDWYAEREGKSAINFGASAGHMRARMAVMNDKGRVFPEDAAMKRAATPEEVGLIETALQQALEQGALGVGIEIAYTPAATYQEVLVLFRLAAKFKRPIFVHLRSGDSVASVQEMLADSSITGAPVHFCHVNSISGDTALILSMLQGARNHGLDVTTEAYPYTAFATGINSSIFADWENKPAEYFASMLWPPTGERLTRESFARYRQLGGNVVRFSNTEERLRTALTHPLAMVASDGVSDHPRGQGTYARILGKYVREEKALSLMESIRKSSLMPAQRLETVSPDMHLKGRVKVGADADLAVFDPSTVIDRATYQNPGEPSNGFRFVLVAGQFVVRDSKLQTGVFPGQGIRAR